MYYFYYKCYLIIVRDLCNYLVTIFCDIDTYNNLEIENIKKPCD